MADVLTGTAMIGVLTNHIASGVAAVLGVNPRDVGSEHLRPWLVSSFAAIAGVFICGRGWCLHLRPWLVSPLAAVIGVFTCRRGWCLHLAAVVGVFTNHI